jgi:hypothetical protein
MFNDRDLGVLGGGALGAILCLMLPWSFAAKITLAVVILVVSMALAFARFGADRLTLEQYIKRQLVFRFQPRRYSYFRKGESVKSSSMPVPSVALRPAIGPITFRLDETGLYWLMTVWLAVIGSYVVYWAQYLDGMKQAAFWIQQTFK